MFFCFLFFLFFFFFFFNIPTAAAANSCLTLCNPIDVSPTGSSVPGILQARILKWVAISFSNAWKWKVKVKSLSHVRLLVTPWTAAFQAPPSMGFLRQENWSVFQCSAKWLLFSFHCWKHKRIFLQYLLLELAWPSRGKPHNIVPHSPTTGSLWSFKISELISLDLQYVVN